MNRLLQLPGRGMRHLLLTLLGLAATACAPTAGLSPGWQFSEPEALDIRQVWQADSVTWIRFGYHVPSALQVVSVKGQPLTWARSGRVIGVRNQPAALQVTLGSLRSAVTYRGPDDQQAGHGLLAEPDREFILARLQSLPAVTTPGTAAPRVVQTGRPSTDGDNLAWSADWRAHAGPAGLSSRMVGNGSDAVIAFVGSAMLPNDAGPVIDQMAEIARAKTGVLMIRADVDSSANSEQRALAVRRAKLVARLLERSGVAPDRLVVASVRDRLDPVRQAGLDSSIRADTQPVHISFKAIASVANSQRRDNG